MKKTSKIFLSLLLAVILVGSSTTQAFAATNTVLVSVPRDYGLYKVVAFVPISVDNTNWHITGTGTPTVTLAGINAGSVKYISQSVTYEGNFTVTVVVVYKVNNGLTAFTDSIVVSYTSHSGGGTGW
jgi:hypothetical protein